MEDCRFLCRARSAKLTAGWIAPIAACLVLAAPDQADAQELAEAFGEIGEAVGELMVEMPEDDRSLDAMQRDLMTLRMSSEQIAPEAEQDYALALSHNAQLLEAATQAEGLERAALIADVEHDIAIKRFATIGMNAGTGFNGRISVRVVTMRGTASVPGYVIELNPVRWTGTDPMYRLASLSPSMGQVPPGRYEVIAKQGGVQVARDVMLIGVSGENTVELQLPVP